ncbi:MAG: hypothetical protein IPM74_02255 [Crocinitomicaceae bacterium]|nr:hypothetical protein [Crocinitomicaceae bacterium]MBK8924739.1 hypothetical protein [Crocinitomicaceae bacterium]
MKKIFYVTSLLALTACGGYTDEQAKAADEFCTCMDKEGDFDILFYECDLEIMTKYKPETFADEGWSLALEEKCPSVAGKLAEQE